MVTNDKHACKILDKTMNNYSEFDVKNEISIHRELEHQHIVKFLDSFEDQKSIYMIQMLCINGSLRHFHKSNGIVSLTDCRKFVSQILKGAQYIHDHEYIHRDMKMSNVLLNSNMNIKIGDFGLATRIDDADIKTLCGTTNYLAPEVISRNGCTCASDVWAIGVIAFVLLFGYKPFSDYDVYSIHCRILRGVYT